eukprot:7272420-Pyramimonas_sp.AAC.1
MAEQKLNTREGSKSIPTRFQETPSDLAAGWGPPTPSVDMLLGSDFGKKYATAEESTARARYPICLLHSSGPVDL